MPALRIRHRTLYLAVAVIAALGLAAVLYTALSTSDKPAGGATGAAPGVFTARTLAGDQVAVPGSRPSVLLFFSVECGGCGPAARAMADAQRQIGDKASFVAVDIPGEADEDIRGFLTDNNATGLAYTRDTGTRVLGAYQIVQNSTVVVLDASGTVVFRAVEPTAEQIRTELTKLSAQ